ncbi:vitamin K epoxide reductase family protein [Actinomyces glycerinitolerans]|uniref:Vitamin k epoxide reductase n=1 Tax=Actinomyces glycerinitolerans TaxID=1892869 RepID=A0A1M4RXA6_9ACTO|nr:vitamin K epoxide reductase family protein [Actinomyces glycerinitolerans]SHE24561.1 vitamin k epoxide reductase [Actinomyces glycerinitolerans]
MTHVPTQAEVDAMIDAMSEEELDAYLAGESSLAVGATAPDVNAGGPETDATATGAPRSYAVLLVIGSLIGIGACWELIASQISQLRDPDATLVCDVSPLVSCGDSLNAWQGNLLGVPNAFVGGMAFAVLTLIGMLLAAGVRLPRWVWWGLVAGTVCGIGFVAWFLVTSVLTFGKLCPFCTLIWLVTIPIATNTWGRAAAGGHLGLPPAASRRLLAGRWWIAGAMYAVIAVIVLVAFWDGWVAMLR